MVLGRRTLWPARQRQRRSTGHAGCRDAEYGLVSNSMLTVEGIGLENCSCDALV